MRTTFNEGKSYLKKVICSNCRVGVDWRQLLRRWGKDTLYSASFWQDLCMSINIIRRIWVFESYVTRLSQRAIQQRVTCFSWLTNENSNIPSKALFVLFKHLSGIWLVRVLHIITLNLFRKNHVHFIRFRRDCAIMSKDLKNLQWVSWINVNIIVSTMTSPILVSCLCVMQYPMSKWLNTPDGIWNLFHLTDSN